MVWRVELSDEAETDLHALRAFDHRRILEGIRSQLTAQPDSETRNRKRLGEKVTADFEFVPPLWELRVGEFRVFYEVNAGDNAVFIHTIRRKPPGMTTAEVLDENR